MHWDNVTKLAQVTQKILYKGVENDNNMEGDAQESENLSMAETHPAQWVTLHNIYRSAISFKETAWFIGCPCTSLVCKCSLLCSGSWTVNHSFTILESMLYYQHPKYTKDKAM